MALLDLLGRRWALRILWELRAGPLNFRDLRAACGDISPTVLAERVAELRDAGIVALDESGYRTTPHGAELLEALAPLNAWAQAWARRAR
jgi:DNA-binding HxlR family transcriptional regulator